MDTKEPEAPPQADGMTRVTSEQFHAKVGPGDIAPRPLSGRGKYHQVTGYVTEWAYQQSRRIVGISDGGTPFLPHRYWLA